MQDFTLGDWYLHYYYQLSNPKESRKANIQLLTLQESDDAWPLAKELIQSSQKQRNIHGVQLLSKKLNRHPPSNIDLENCYQFVMAIKPRDQNFWLCIAKIVLHLSPETPRIPSNLSFEQTLKFLQAIPTALSQVRTSPPFDSDKMKYGFLDQGMDHLIKGIQQYQQIVLKTIDSFLTFNTNIKNEQLVSLLLKIPFEESCDILQNILSRSYLPGLQNEVLTYLAYNRADQQAFQMHVSFLKGAPLTTLKFQDATSILQYILNCMNINDQQTLHRQASSFELWQQLSQKYRQNYNEIGNLSDAIRDTFLTLWNMACNRSILEQMPVIQHTEPDVLCIDLDTDDYGDDLLPKAAAQVNKKALFFRDYAEDFIVLCLQTFSQNPQVLKYLFSIVQTFAKGDLLHLQLATFICQTITSQSNQQILSHSSQILQVIFNRSQEMTQHICSKMISIIAQMGQIIKVTPDLLMPTLLFLSKSLQYDQLATNGSFSLESLLDAVDPTVINMGQSLQQFMEHAYNIFFKEEGKKRVLQNLARGMAIFIYKFKSTVQDYSAYLQHFHSQSQQLSLIQKMKLIDAAMDGQLWINNQQNVKNRNSSAQMQITGNNRYMEAFAQYIEKQVPTFLQYLKQAKNKKQTQDAIKHINSALITNAVGNGLVWSNMCDFLLSNHLHIQKPKPFVIAPCKNLVKSAIYLDLNQQLLTNVCALLSKWYQPISNLLDFTLKKHQFDLCSYILDLHIQIVKLIKKYPTCREQINYQPDTMVQYCIQMFMRTEVWEYQGFKKGLEFFIVVLQLGYPPSQILLCLMKNYAKLEQTLWHKLHPILTLIHKTYGFELFQQTFTKIDSPLGQPTNPLNLQLRRALTSDETKTIKNILLSLS